VKLTLFTLVAAAVALGLAAEWAALYREPLEAAATAADLRLAVADLVAGWALIGAGLVAWWRRRQSRIGLLLAAAGFSWFLGTFADSSIDALASFGGVFVTLHRGPLAHALLSYPRGRLDGRAERAAVAFAYGTAVIVDVAQNAVITLVTAGLILTVAARRSARAAGPERHARMRALALAAAYAAVLVTAGIADVVTAGRGFDRGVLWAYQVVMVVIAGAFVTDLLAGRWTRATVTGLVVELGARPEQGTLRDRLATALGDPSLTIGYRIGEDDAYVDEAGRPIELPSAGSGRETTVLRHDGEPIAALVHDAGLLEDRSLIDSVAAAAQIALANVQLQAAIARQLQELEASRRRILEAGDLQRRRLERELHDGAQQRLARVGALLDGVSQNGDQKPMLAEARNELERAQVELREFARGIHPRALTEGGLPAALADLVRTAAVPVEVEIPAERFGPELEAAVYFVCSEALANVGKYAQASRARVEVVRRGDHLVVRVGDDGVGGASLTRGSGLRGLADRVEALGGALSVQSPPGQGTLLAAELPVT
jgi:signal transduction histidine kinase